MLLRGLIMLLRRLLILLNRRLIMSWRSWLSCLWWLIMAVAISVVGSLVYRIVNNFSALGSWPFSKILYRLSRSRGHSHHWRTLSTTNSRSLSRHIIPLRSGRDILIWLLLWLLWLWLWLL